MSDYFNHVWDEIAEPKWAADTGLPLAVTILGLLATYVFLMRQLRSDRKLRRAEHKRDAATRLWIVLSEAAKRLRATDPEDDWWRSHVWGDAVDLNDSLMDAVVLLPTGWINSLRQLTVTTSEGWRAAFVEP